MQTLNLNNLYPFDMITLAEQAGWVTQYIVEAGAIKLSLELPEHIDLTNKKVSIELLDKQQLFIDYPELLDSKDILNMTDIEYLAKIAQSITAAEWLINILPGLNTAECNVFGNTFKEILDHAPPAVRDDRGCRIKDTKVEINGKIIRLAVCSHGDLYITDEHVTVKNKIVPPKWTRLPAAAVIMRLKSISGINSDKVRFESHTSRAALDKFYVISIDDNGILCDSDEQYIKEIYDSIISVL